MIKEVSWDLEGSKVVGKLFTPKQNAKPLAFLFIHGWTGHQNVLAAQAVCDLGFTSMTFGLRGQGESEGDINTLSRADYVQDAVAAYDFLKSKSGATKIGLVGSSFGSYLASLLTNEREVECLSLRVPALYPDEGFDESHFPQSGTEKLMKWRNTTLQYSENSALNAIHDFKGNVQIIEAEKDELVSHINVMNYVNALSDPGRLEHVVMENAPHRLANEELANKYKNLLSDWVQKYCI